MKRGWKDLPGPHLGCSCGPHGALASRSVSHPSGEGGCHQFLGPSLTDELHAGPLPRRWPAQRDPTWEYLLGLGVPGSKPRVLAYVSKPMGLISEAGGSSDVVTGEGRQRWGHCNPGPLLEHSSDRQVGRAGESGEGGREGESSRVNMRTSLAGVWSSGF